MKKYKTDVHITNTIAEEPAVAYLRASQSSLTIIHDARKGIKIGELMALGEEYSLSMLELSKILNVSLRTLQRYNSENVLDADGSAKIIQLQQLMDHGVSVFGDATAFSEWLKSPLSMIEDMRPIDILDTPFGYQVLSQILGRIEHGIFA